MHIVTEGHLKRACLKYPDAAKEISAWIRIVRQSRWMNFIELRKTFPDADSVDEYVVFNFRHNRYRLITIPHYCRLKDGIKTMGHIYIRSFLTHKEYNDKRNWEKGVR
jgi:mRNA interferase HigB